MNKDRLGDAYTLINAAKKLIEQCTPMDPDICFGIQKWMEEAARHIKVSLMDDITEPEKEPAVTVFVAPEPAKKPYPVGSPEAAEAVQRVKAREEERMASKTKKRPGRPRKASDE